MENLKKLNPGIRRPGKERPQLEDHLPLCNLRKCCEWFRINHPNTCEACPGLEINFFQHDGRRCPELRKQTRNFQVTAVASPQLYDPGDLIARLKQRTKKQQFWWHWSLLATWPTSDLTSSLRIFRIYKHLLANTVYTVLFFPPHSQNWLTV